MIPDVDGYARVGGNRLYYRRVGEPVRGTVLALHGGPGLTYEYLTPLADLAGAGYEVVFYDQLGCGRSSRPRGYSDYSVRSNAEDVEELRRSLSLGRVHLFGHSYGGALALEAVVRHPKSWRSLVVSSGFASMRALWRSVRLRVSQLSSTSRRAWLASDRSSKTSRATARAVEEFRRRFSEHSVNRPFEILMTFQRANRRISKATGFLRDRLYDDGYRDGTMAGWDITPLLDRVRIPTLITVGQYDHVGPVCAREIHRAISRSHLVVARGEGHLPFFESRDRYVTLLRTFFDRAR